MKLSSYVINWRILCIWVALFVCFSCNAFAQTMVMPPATLCDGASGAEVINTGQTLNITNADAPHPCIEIKTGGTVNVPAGVTLTAGHIQLNGGTLNGNATGGITFTDTAPTDEGKWRGGLIQLSGTFHVRGNKRKDWVRLTGPLAVGATQMTVDATPDGWVVGDKLVLGDSRQVSRLDALQFHPVELTITARTGNVITFTPALEYARPCAMNELQAQDRCPAVGALTQGFVLQSANPSGTRAHYLAAHDSVVDLEGVEFLNMGRTTNEPLSSSNLARMYAFHMHYLDGTPARAENISVVHSLKWGLTAHHGDNGVFRNWVIFDSWGAGVMTEDGDEVNNTFDHFLVVQVRGTNETSERPGEPGTSGSCGWFFPRSRVTNFIAQNCYNGFALFGGPVFDQEAPGQYGPPLLEFADNESWSNYIGMVSWWKFAAEPSYVTRHYEAHSQYWGYFGYPTTNLHFVDWIGRGDQSRNGYDDNTGGWWAGDYGTMRGELVRPKITGKYIAMRPHYGAPLGAQMTPQDPDIQDFIVTDAKFSFNGKDVYNETASTSYNPSQQRQVRTTFIRPCFGSTVKVEQNWTGNEPLATLPQQTYIIDYCNTTGDSFQVFYPQRAPSGATTRTGIANGVIEAITVAAPPVNCVVSSFGNYSAWSAWAAINATQESRTRTRTRTVTTPASGGGTACSALSETDTETRTIVVTPPPTGCATPGPATKVAIEIEFATAAMVVKRLDVNGCMVPVN